MCGMGVSELPAKGAQFALIVSQILVWLLNFENDEIVLI